MASPVLPIAMEPLKHVKDGLINISEEEEEVDDEEDEDEPKQKKLYFIKQ